MVLFGDLELSAISESAREKYPEFAGLEWICIIDIYFYLGKIAVAHK
jgi:hypothetical protein